MLCSQENLDNKESIINRINKLEKNNKENCDVINNVYYHYLCELKKTMSFFKKGKIKLVFLQVVGLMKGMIIRLKYTNATEISNSTNDNYFLNERIAIYTVIYGQYDLLKEPCMVPDNCDFFVITDNEVSEKSVWKKLNDNSWDNVLKNKTSVEKNRFFKMNPHILFPQYKYSIYIDGSIKVISDLTPLIYRMGRLKMGFFCHPGRNCVFNELKVLKITNRIIKEERKKYILFLKKENMPRHFGMVECGLIVREHNDPACIFIMEKWWEMFCDYAKRDQVLLPYILWKNQNTIADVATLGLNIRRYYGIRVEEHK